MPPPPDTIEITDPRHPLYGLTLACFGVTLKQRLGRVCIVWLHPGVEQLVPVAATSLVPGSVVPCPATSPSPRPRRSSLC